MQLIVNTRNEHLKVDLNFADSFSYQHPNTREKCSAFDLESPTTTVLVDFLLHRGIVRGEMEREKDDMDIERTPMSPISYEGRRY